MVRCEIQQRWDIIPRVSSQQLMNEEIADVEYGWGVDYHLILPSNFDVKEFDYDRMFSRPQSIAGLVEGDDFEYRGHTWHCLQHDKIVGNIRNIPDSPRLRGTEMGMYNYLTGNKFSLVRFVRFGSTRYWRYRQPSSRHTVDAYFDYILGVDPSSGRFERFQCVTIIAYAFDQGIPTPRIVTCACHIYYVKLTDRFRYGRFNYSVGLRQALYFPADMSVSELHSAVRALLSVHCNSLVLSTNARRLPLSFVGLVGDPKLKYPNYDVIFASKRINPNWREIAGRAYQSLGMADINGIANSKELLEMGAACTSFAGVLKSLPTRKVKAAASAFLAIHYGFKLAILDAMELREVLITQTERRSSLSKCQAASNWRHGTFFVSARYQVFYDQFAQLESYLDRFLALSDAFLTMENVWDMVPYSFVIDWFVGVGDVLQSMDNYLNLIQRHEVICVGRSIKALDIAAKDLLELPAGWLPVTLEVSTFRRLYQKRLLQPSLVPSVTLNPFDHLVEAAALIISK